MKSSKKNSVSFKTNAQYLTNETMQGQVLLRYINNHDYIVCVKKIIIHSQIHVFDIIDLRRP